MKMLYKCELCAAEFNEYEECSNHEKLCKENHATGFRLADEINRAISTAKQNGKIAVGVCADDGGKVYCLDGAKYDPITRQVNLDICFDDELMPKKAVQDD